MGERYPHGVVQLDRLNALEDVKDKAQAVIKAYARRWAIVDCTPEEERTLRELNDAMQFFLAETP